MGLCLHIYIEYIFLKRESKTKWLCLILFVGFPIQPLCWLSSSSWPAFLPNSGSTPSCFLLGAKTSQMGVINPAAPKYKNFCSKSPPNVCNSECNYLTATSGITMMGVRKCGQCPLLYHHECNPLVQSASYLIWVTKIYSRYAHVLNVADI